jgi:hypothetical protein
LRGGRMILREDWILWWGEPKHLVEKRVFKRRGDVPSLSDI